MRSSIITGLLLLVAAYTNGQNVVSAKSPDQKISLTVKVVKGMPLYSIAMEGKEFIGESPLGLLSSIGDFSKDLKLAGQKTRKIQESYNLTKSKVSKVKYAANELNCTFLNAAGDTIHTIFRITNSDVAFSYLIPQNGKGKMMCTVEKELTGFNIASGSTSFITPQAPAGGGWMRTKPSYEEGYTKDAPVEKKSSYGLGYTYPALFHLSTTGWVLISETGVDGNYVGTRLSDRSEKGIYSVSFPEQAENNKVGAVTAEAMLPMQTSWKTITVATDLKPIVASTSATDVVKPLTSSSKVFSTGRASWSWIVWQDASCNYDDQVTFINLAADLKCEFILIDALWDVNIGKAKMEELVKYARSKNVGVLLWYNSNGKWNDAPQTPKNRMDTQTARQEEMAWLQKIGVKGMKVDFFGGDKQVTMKLYHDILMDATTYGLTVNFHGTTLPRGWERMYPSFVTSEAVLASENLAFSQGFYDNYATTATIYPFTRNAVAAMDFGPVFLNKRLARNPNSGVIRKTTDAFEMATAVVFFSPIQHWGITPENLKDKPAFLFDYLKKVPTVWDETQLIAGYPGKYCVIARRKGKQWYVAAINGENKERVLNLELPFLSGKKVNVIKDGEGFDANSAELKMDKTGKVELRLSGNGGAVIYSQ